MVVKISEPWSIQCFKSDSFDMILISVGLFPLFSCIGTWLENQSLYRFWRKHSFSALFTLISNGRNFLVRLWGTITTSQLFSGHSSLRILLPWPLNMSIIITQLLLYRISLFFFGHVKAWKNNLFKEFDGFLGVWAMVFCKADRKWTGKFKLWQAAARLFMVDRWNW